MTDPTDIRDQIEQELDQWSQQELRRLRALLPAIRSALAHAHQLPQPDALFVDEIRRVQQHVDRIKGEDPGNPLT